MKGVCWGVGGQVRGVCLAPLGGEGRECISCDPLQISVGSYFDCKSVCDNFEFARWLIHQKLDR